MSEEKIREQFEIDAAPYGFDLAKNHCAVPEPWSEEYRSNDTGHRWAGWQAACAHKDAEFAKEREQLRALIAMQAEFITGAQNHVGSMVNGNVLADLAKSYADASAESVAAWEAGKLEPLRREVAMLRDVLARVDNDAQSGRGKILSCGHTWPCGCSHSDALKVISNTQATAEAYERELKAKVLEEAQMFCEEEAARIRLDDVRATTVAVMTATSIAHHFNFEAAELRTQSAQKKGGE